jgi:hypothetical protein
MPVNDLERLANVFDDTVTQCKNAPIPKRIRAPLSFDCVGGTATRGRGGVYLGLGVNKRFHQCEVDFLAGFRTSVGCVGCAMVGFVKSFPQNRQTMASSWISSAQYGHFFMVISPKRYIAYKKKDAYMVFFRLFLIPTNFSFYSKGPIYVLNKTYKKYILLKHFRRRKELIANRDNCVVHEFH